METQEETLPALPILDAEEIRILGSLIEKSRATPEYYPMTINGLTAACNQKSSRKPVVQYDEETIVATLDRLKRKGLVCRCHWQRHTQHQIQTQPCVALPTHPRRAFGAVPFVPSRTAYPRRNQ